MSDVELEALKPHRYARRDLRAGDSYSASEADARVLVAMRRARLCGATLPTPPQETPPAVDKRPRKRGTYRTRRLKAES